MRYETNTPPPWRRWLVKASLLVYLAVMLVVVVLLFTGKQEKPEPIFGSLDGRFRSKVTMQLNDKTLYYRDNEVTNYLIIGLDRNAVGQTQRHQQGGQADFLVVLSIDRIRRTITPVMLDRDTMTSVQTYGVFGHPSGKREMQLCLAHAYSGLETTNSDNTKLAVEELLYGISIDRCVVLDISAVALMNDALGGVVVKLQDDFTVFDPAMTRGTTLRLQGQQAEFFVRGRMTVADGTNASRMGRQQQYLSGLLEQFHRRLDEQPSLIDDLMKAVDGHMTADVKDETLVREINAYSDYQWQTMQTLVGNHAIDDAGFAEFWVNKSILKRFVADLWFEE